MERYSSFLVDKLYKKALATSKGFIFLIKSQVFLMIHHEIYIVDNQT